MISAANLKLEERFQSPGESEVDWTVNAVLSAFTRDLGRPFVAGGRNVRSIINKWDPLLQDLSQFDYDTFQRSYLTAHFLDRYFYAAEIASSKLSLEREALEKFKLNLSKGSAVNERLSGFLEYGKLNSILCSASLEIHRVLGPLEMEEWFSLCAHGPNASYRVRKDSAYADNKAVALDGTLPAIQLFKQYLGWNTNLAAYLEPKLLDNSLSFELVAGNRLSFVPKKWNSLRTMSVEPTLNQFLQQGLGGVITRRLKSFLGIDLSNQDCVHKDLVKVITKHDLPIATIDWSQASDRIWLGLCQRLLPSDWFAAICDTRSPIAEYNYKELVNGKLVDRMESLELTMAGTMGNGFCFPLQTLLFTCVLRALARECGLPQFVTVFGDDCICDSSLKDEIVWFATEIGWLMNESKSFFSGPFRESCGCDAFAGRNCRPFRIERPNNVDTPEDLASWAYSVYNQLNESVDDKLLPNVAEWLVKFLASLGLAVNAVPPRFSVASGVRFNYPNSFQPFAPHTVNFPLQDYYYPYNGFTFSFLTPKTKQHIVDQEPYYILALEGKGAPKDFLKYKFCEEEISDDADPGYVPSKARSRIVRKTGYVHTWSYPFSG